MYITAVYLLFSLLFISPIPSLLFIFYHHIQKEKDIVLQILYIHEFNTSESNIHIHV